MNIDKFKKWLTDRGVEILPCSNAWELLRFKGKEIGVLYKSGKVSNPYTTSAIRCYKHSKQWNGWPLNIGRKNNYKKEKAALIERDGIDCFYCGLPLCEDITLEHLIALSSGGKNTLANMVLCHEECNQAVKNMPISKKVEYAITNRSNYKIQ